RFMGFLSTPQLFNLSTFQLINLSTPQLLNFSTYQLFNHTIVYPRLFDGTGWVIISLNGFLFFEMMVCEFQKVNPIIFRQIVFSFADMIAHRRIYGWRIVRGK